MNKDILKNYVVENYSESLKVLKRAELMAGIDESESTVGKVMKFFKEVNDYGVSSIPVVGSSLQKVGNGVIQLCDDDRINRIAADHSLDGADVDIEVNNATDIVTSTRIKHQERIESPIVRKYENPNHRKRRQRILYRAKIIIRKKSPETLLCSRQRRYF